MAKKLKDLEGFMNGIKTSLDFPKEISHNTLRRFIANEYGYSHFILKDTLTALIDFGFLRIGDHQNIYEIVYKDQAEKEAEKEADEILKKVVKKEG